MMNRILVLLEHRGNRRLLSEYLAENYEVVSPGNHGSAAEQLLRDEAFDLGIVDGPALEHLRPYIRERKAAEQSVSLPFLLVTSRQDLGLARRHLWQTVDELIFAPIERVELLARIEILLQMRRISLESDQRYFALAANSPVGVAIVQADRIAYANELLMNLLEIGKEEMQSTGFLERFHPDDRPEITGQRGEWLGGTSASPLEVRTAGPSRVRWVEIRTASLRHRGEPARLYVVSDISARKQIELELRRAKAEAEHLARLKSSILDNLSHEIRTPLTSIIGFADVLYDEVPAQYRTEVDMIRSGGERLLETLTSVLTLSQLESKNLRPSPSRFDLIELIRETLALFEPQAEARGLRLAFRPPSPNVVQVYMDRAAVGRILSNLLSNAIKFSREGQVTVAVEVDDFVEIAVSDTGVGISPEFLPEIFDEFKQESSGMTRGFEGVGLGLTITKRLVDLLGGGIRVESRKGEGSVFSVRLLREWEGDA